MIHIIKKIVKASLINLDFYWFLSFYWFFLKLFNFKLIQMILLNFHNIN